MHDGNDPTPARRGVPGRILTRVLGRPIAWVVVGLIRAYQIFVSPMLGPHCRFTPTCSSYAIGAIQKHGVLRGGWAAVRRIGRCHPWNPGGYDPP